MNGEQETLFAGVVTPGEPYLLTNRYNLLQMLGSQLLEPVEAFSKYYRDLLEQCPGRLPLIGQPFPADLVALVSSEDPTAFPVAIEVDPAVLGPETPTADLVNSSMNDGSTLAWAPAGVIPIDRVKAIHFRTEGELDEHRVRDYENVRHASDRYRVTPDLFGSHGQGAASLTEWLRSLPAPAEQVSPDGVPGDRLGGALALMAAQCPPLEAAIETLRRCIEAAPSRKGKRPYADWMVAVIQGSTSRRPGVDEILFAVALRTFAHADTAQSWRGADVLSSIWNVVGSRLEADDRDRLGQHFARMKEIIRSERPFERLRPHGPPAEKGLLLALLRPDPVRLAAWGSDETGAEWPETLTAAALVGALKGRQRIPVELRDREIDALLAAREAAAWNTSARSTILLEPVPPVRYDNRSLGGADRVRLTVGRSTLMTWDVRALGQFEPDQEGTALENRDLSVEPAVIALCDELGWNDCTLTEIETSGRALQPVDASGTTYSVEGPVTVRRTLDSVRLQARLDSPETSTDERLRVNALLAGSAQTTSGSQRYSN
jgi:hypothetical protein